MITAKVLHRLEYTEIRQKVLILTQKKLIQSSDLTLLARDLEGTQILNHEIFVCVLTDDEVF